MTIVDSHQHFWRLDRGDYGWLTPQLAPIYSDYLPAAPRAAACACRRRHDHAGAGGADGRRKRGSCSALARENPFIAGVVGWVDFESPDARRTIAELAADRSSSACGR